MTPSSDSRSLSAFAGQVALAFCIMLVVTALPSYASSSGFSGGSQVLNNLRSLVDWITGPVGSLMGIVGFAACGFTWMFSDNKTGAKFAGRVAIGCVVVVGSAHFSELFGFSSALM